MDMSAYEVEDWVALYRSAIVELEHAKVSGRIEAARNAIVARVQKLHDMPGLHSDERMAIADALSGLHVCKTRKTGATTIKNAMRWKEPWKNCATSVPLYCGLRMSGEVRIEARRRGGRLIEVSGTRNREIVPAAR
jgi:hypothetical protein